MLNPQTRTIDVFLRIPNPMRGGAPVPLIENKRKSATSSGAPPLFVGSFVDAEITGKALEKYAVLPLAALKAGNKVWLVRDGKLHIFTVEIFQRTDKAALISTAGLGANPLVVTGSLKIATEGLKVRIAKPRAVTKDSKRNGSKAPADK